MSTIRRALVMDSKISGALCDRASTASPIMVNSPSTGDRTRQLGILFIDSSVISIVTIRLVCYRSLRCAKLGGYAVKVVWLYRTIQDATYEG